MDDLRSDLFTVGTLGALNYVVRGMSEMPGRKSILLMSDGISIHGRGGKDDRTLIALQRLTDLREPRFGRGLHDGRPRPSPLGLTAADNTSGRRPDQIDQELSKPTQRLFRITGRLELPCAANRRVLCSRQ
ncbi:MAG: hypothetical protein WKF84_15560 [Pyrinomonadaceae bacterium]